MADEGVLPAGSLAFRRIGEMLLDFLFPRRCMGCGREGDFLCAGCAAALPVPQAPLCPRCGLPLLSAASCADCSHLSPAIEGIRSPYLHEGLARDLVHALKYDHFKALAGPAARLMARYLEARPLPADLLVAVPIHPKRLRRRGYNQAELIARKLSGLTGMPLAGGALVRIRDTGSQVALGAQARRQNVAAAFVCRSGGLTGKRILLIDDVCTTGATLGACAEALRVAGAAGVWGFTFSREC